MQNNLNRRDFAALALGAASAGVSSAPAEARSFGALSLNTYGQDQFAGYTWGTQKPSGTGYSIQEDIAFSPRHHRFEVRSTDSWNGEAYVNRAEFNCRTKEEFGQDVWFSYALKIRAGVPVTDWNVLGQFHQTADPGEGGPPPFGVNFMPGEKLRFIRRYNPLELDSQPTSSIMHTHPAVRDRWYRIVGQIRFGWQNDGKVNLWLDGAKIVSLSNTNIGNNDIEGPYFKFGIYRAKVAETLIVEYANLELSHSSLLNRVTSPLPL